jgi:uncharacterized protein
MTQYSPPADVTSDDKLWSLLTYILSPLVPIIVLLMEDKKNRPFIKAHNAQALVLGIVGWVINGVLTPVFGLGCITSVIYLVLVIYWGVKAYQGNYVNIPIITDWCKNQGWA